MASFQHKGRVIVSWVVIILSLAIIGFALVQQQRERGNQIPSKTPQKTEETKSTPKAAPSAEETPLHKDTENDALKNLSTDQQEKMLSQAAKALRPSYEVLYMDFMQEAGLSEEQGARLIEMLVEDQQKMIRESVFVDSHLPSPGRLQTPQDEIIEKIREEFGEETASQYQEYRKTLADRGLLLSLRREFSPPLTPQQTTQTTKILAEERLATMSQLPSDPSLHIEKIKAMYERVVHRLQPILSPDQIAVLRAHFDKMIRPSPHGDLSGPPQPTE